MSKPSQNSIFRQQQQLYRSSHYFGKPKTSTFFTSSSPVPQDASNNSQSKGRKRRASEDELMEDSVDGSTTTRSSLDISRSEDRPLATPRSRQDKILHCVKRNRIGAEKQFPLDKLLAPLDKEKLIELIQNLVETNPRLQPEIDEMIMPSANSSLIR